MDSADEAPPRRPALQAGAGLLLTLLGASALLWLTFDDSLRATPSPDPADVTIWAVVRVAAAIALAAGTWLLAVAMVNRRRRG